MVWYNPLSLGRKRTEADIQKAKLLQTALECLDSGIYLIKSTGQNFLTESIFKVTLEGVKQSLDSTKDPKYIAAIDSVIAKWKNLRTKVKSLTAQEVLSETEIIEKDLGILRLSIIKEIHKL